MSTFEKNYIFRLHDISNFSCIIWKYARVFHLQDFIRYIFDIIICLFSTIQGHLFIGKYTYMQIRKSTKLLDPANKHPKKIFFTSTIS